MEERKKLGKKGRVMLSVTWTRRDNASDPKNLLKKVKNEFEKLRKRKEEWDSVWIVSDNDGRPRAQLDEIKTWVEEEREKRRWILSNRDFEYWLRVHFQSNGDWKRFEERYYDHQNNKKVNNNDFTYEQIVHACKKARAKKQTISDLYDQKGSLMYEIVEFIGKEYQLCSEDSQGGVSWESVNS